MAQAIIFCYGLEAQRSYSSLSAESKQVTRVGSARMRTPPVGVAIPLAAPRKIEREVLAEGCRLTPLDSESVLVGELEPVWKD